MSVTFDVEIAYDDTLEAFPDWQALSDMDGLVLVGWDIRRGRTDEFQRTGTGTANIYLTDVDGVFGPDTPLPVHVQVSLRGSLMFRGHLKRRSAVVHPSGVVTNITLECVDAFDLFGRIEIADEFKNPGFSSQRVWGSIPPNEVAENGDIFYEDGQVDDRIIEVLTDAHWPASMRSIFSGNVNVMESIYPPGTTVMQMLQDAADAEFPDVANLFMGGSGDADLCGQVVFRGRYSRFNPGAYDIPTWLAATGDHVTSSHAPVRELDWEDGTEQIYNTALCYPDPERHPQKIVMNDQFLADDDSRTQWGPKSWSAENILTLRHNTNGNTGAEECQVFNQYIIENFAQPIPRVTRITLRSLGDGEQSAAANWAMMKGAEIGDQVELTTDWISGTYFIEGITASVAHGNGTVPDATVTYDLSPAAHWTVDPF